VALALRLEGAQIHDGLHQDVRLAADGHARVKHLGAGRVVLGHIAVGALQIGEIGRPVLGLDGVGAHPSALIVHAVEGHARLGRGIQHQEVAARDVEQRIGGAHPHLHHGVLRERLPKDVLHAGAHGDGVGGAALGTPHQDQPIPVEGRLEPGKLGGDLQLLVRVEGLGIQRVAELDLPGGQRRALFAPAAAMVHHPQGAVGVEAETLGRRGLQRSLGRGRPGTERDLDARVAGQGLDRSCHQEPPGLLAGDQFLDARVAGDLVLCGQADGVLGFTHADLQGAQHGLGLDPLVEGQEEHGMEGLGAALGVARGQARGRSGEAPRGGLGQGPAGLGLRPRRHLDGEAGGHRQPLVLGVEKDRPGPDPAPGPPRLGGQAHGHGLGGLGVGGDRHHGVREGHGHLGGQGDVTFGRAPQHLQRARGHRFGSTRRCLRGREGLLHRGSRARGRQRACADGEVGTLAAVRLEGRQAGQQGLDLGLGHRLGGWGLGPPGLPRGLLTLGQAHAEAWGGGDGGGRAWSRFLREGALVAGAGPGQQDRQEQEQHHLEISHGLPNGRPLAGILPDPPGARRISAPGNRNGLCRWIRRRPSGTLPCGSVRSEDQGR